MGEKIGIAPSVGCQGVMPVPIAGMCWADLPTQHSAVLIPLSTPMGSKDPAASDAQSRSLGATGRVPSWWAFLILSMPSSCHRPALAVLAPVPSCLPQGVSHAATTQPVRARSASLANPSTLLIAAGDPTAASSPPGQHHQRWAWDRSSTGEGAAGVPRLSGRCSGKELLEKGLFLTLPQPGGRQGFSLGPSVSYSASAGLVSGAARGAELCLREGGKSGQRPTP